MIILKGAIFYEEDTYSNSFQLVLGSNVWKLQRQRSHLVAGGRIHCEEEALAWPTVILLWLRMVM